MTDLIIRNVPDEVLAEIESQASLSNQSRQQYLKTRLEELAEVGWQPASYGDGLKCYTPNGGRVTLKRLTEGVQTGARGLTQEEFEAYKRAKMLVSPKNGSQWAEGRKILEAAGFEVFNI